jgi:putative tricarboxylic transport membrane protein
MSETSHLTGRGPSHRRVEIGVAIATATFGIIVMIGSLEVGITWGVEGPRAGFFPFYVGLTILISSAVNLYRVRSEVPVAASFADWRQLRSVVSVVIPTAVYVLLVPYLGIYLASALLIGTFMKWLGRYDWGRTAALSLAVPLITYFMFERWFLVPLPKGPIEEWLGL